MFVEHARVGVHRAEGDIRLELRKGWNWETSAHRSGSC